LAREIAEIIIQRIKDFPPGPEYNEAVRAGAVYWETVLAGKPDLRKKEAADEALSKLLGCRAQVAGRKLGFREMISRAIFL
jgi:hypothetical protein